MGSDESHFNVSAHYDHGTPPFYCSIVKWISQFIGMNASIWHPNNQYFGDDYFCTSVFPSSTDVLLAIAKQLPIKLMLFHSYCDGKQHVRKGSK